MFSRRTFLGASAGLAMVAVAAMLPARAADNPRATAEAAARSIVATSAVPDAAVDCVAPAGDPAPGTQMWTLRDEENQYCATQRLADEYGSPAFGSTFWAETPGIYSAQTIEMAMDPTHPHASLGQVIPGGTTADPFRTLARWTGAARGRVTPVSFPAQDGAVLNGYVFEPPPTVIGPYPGIVITTGSIQGYQQLYFWAAEGLAEAGYMVLTYDVQGQGNSDTLPSAANCTGPNSCEGVPFQQNYNFFQGTQDALNFFFSTPAAPYQGTHNPAYADLDTARVGVAGHSLGASAVSQVGQEDRRVKAIVAWDNLAPAGASVTFHAPALGINSEYFFNPEPMTAPPDPHSKDSGYQQLVQHGIDTMQVALRSSMHLEYSYVPYILPASRLGERVAFYYTLAWFDRYVRGDTSATNRLIATTFDASADASAIGAGAYDPQKAAADAADTAAGNVPYRLDGLLVSDRLSFYYQSEYSLTGHTCGDMRHRASC